MGCLKVFVIFQSTVSKNRKDSKELQGRQKNGEKRIERRAERDNMFFNNL